MSLIAVILIGIALFVVSTNYYVAQLNRTHERPLLVDANNLVLKSAHRLLGILPITPSENSLQFVVMPSFGNNWVAVSVTEVNGVGVGHAIIEDQKRLSHETRTFVVPMLELRPFLERWDALTDGYSGESRMLTDGNPMAFERKRKNSFTSGVGNSPCHEDVLNDWAAQRLVRYVPELQNFREVWLDKMLTSDACSTSIFKF